MKTTYLSNNGKIFTLNNKIILKPPYILPKKGGLINMDLDGQGDKTYRVLAINGNIVKVLGMSDVSNSQSFNTNFEKGMTYAGSDLDIYLNTTWYNTLSDIAKTAIVPESRTQYTYIVASALDNYTYIFKDDLYFYLNDSVLIGDRNIFTLEIKDIYDYFDKTSIIDGELTKLWTNQTDRVDKNWWLSSLNANTTGVVTMFYGTFDRFAFSSIVDKLAVRPAFNIDLSKIDFTKTMEVIA